MGPIAKDTAAKYKDKSIEFVTFDFTSDETKAKAEADAKRLGVEAIYKANAPKTGFALLYDTANSKVVTKLSAKNDVAAWSAAIDKAFQG